MSTNLQADPHQRTVVQALSTQRWRACQHVADDLSWSLFRTSRVLAALSQRGVVERRAATAGAQHGYEYRLRLRVDDG